MFQQNHKPATDDDDRLSILHFGPQRLFALQPRRGEKRGILGIVCPAAGGDTQMAELTFKVAHAFDDSGSISTAGSFYVKG